MDNVNVTEKFVPYDRIIVGSNEISCNYLININGFYPIIIGKGDTPRIWLYVMVNGNRMVLVNDSKEMYNWIKIRIDKTKKTVSIVLKESDKPDLVILFADFENEGVFSINKMNLKPIGLSVISNEKELIVGNNHLSGNIVSGVDSFIALSE